MIQKILKYWEIIKAFIPVVDLLIQLLGGFSAALDFIKALGSSVKRLSQNQSVSAEDRKKRLYAMLNQLG